MEFKFGGEYNNDYDNFHNNYRGRMTWRMTIYQDIPELINEDFMVKEVDKISLWRGDNSHIIITFTDGTQFTFTSRERKKIMGTMLYDCFIALGPKSNVIDPIIVYSPTEKNFVIITKTSIATSDGTFAFNIFDEGGDQSIECDMHIRNNWIRVRAV
jgi:hypothetical protein